MEPGEELENWGPGYAMTNQPKLSQLIEEQDDAFFGEYGHIADAVRGLESRIDELLCERKAVLKWARESDSQLAAMREAGNNMCNALDEAEAAHVYVPMIAAWRKAAR